MLHYNDIRESSENFLSTHLTEELLNSSEQRAFGQFLPLCLDSRVSCLLLLSLFPPVKWEKVPWSKALGSAQTLRWLW